MSYWYFPDNKSCVIPKNTSLFREGFFVLFYFVLIFGN